MFGATTSVGRRQVFRLVHELRTYHGHRNNCECGKPRFLNIQPNIRRTFNSFIHVSPSYKNFTHVMHSAHLHKKEVQKVWSLQQLQSISLSPMKTHVRDLNLRRKKIPLDDISNMWERRPSQQL